MSRRPNFSPNYSSAVSKEPKSPFPNSSPSLPIESSSSRIQTSRKFSKFSIKTTADKFQSVNSSTFWVPVNKSHKKFGFSWWKKPMPIRTVWSRSSSSEIWCDLYWTEKMSNFSRIDKRKRFSLQNRRTVRWHSCQFLNDQWGKK